MYSLLFLLVLSIQDSGRRKEANVWLNPNPKFQKTGKENKNEKKIENILTLTLY